jgi:hypothetical protein
MSEQAEPTPGASEADQSAAGAANPGAAADGGSATSQAGADTFATERDSYEAERRQLQSQRDRLRAEVAELEGKRGAAAKSDEGPRPLTAEEMRREMQSTLLRTQELSDAKVSLRERYPDAEDSVFARAYEFESAEDFAVAVERSHNAISKTVEARLAAREAEIRERYEKAYGPLKESPVDTGQGGGITGALPTVQQLASMPFAEYEEAEEKWGKDTIDKILRQAS